MEEFDRFFERVHLALDAFFTGDPEPAKQLYSHSDDATLNNPFGPPVRGWAAVADAMDRAAAHYRDGRATGFERVAGHTTADLGYIVEIEHYEARVGGSAAMVPVSLRVTTIARREDDAWKIVHRHADPITSTRSAESVTQGKTP